MIFANRRNQRSSLRKKCATFKIQFGPNHYIGNACNREILANSGKLIGIFESRTTTCYKVGMIFSNRHNQRSSMRKNVTFFLKYSLIYSIQDGHVDWMCEGQIYSIHYIFVRQTMTTNSIGQNTAKASVIQVIHVASLGQYIRAREIT
jgi:hypothetical protein